MLIEFIGCPGVGKSSICVRVMERLAGEGYAVENIHRSEMRKGAWARKLYTFEALYGIRNKALRDAVNTYEADNANPGSSVWKRDLLIAAMKLDRKSVKKLDAAFFEEGPTQYLSSIVHLDPIDETAGPVIHQMNKTIYSHDITAFYVTADIGDISERIRKRNRKSDRFKGAEDTEMIRQLKIKEANLDYLTKRLDYREIYRIENRELDTAVSEVYSIISRNIMR